MCKVLCDSFIEAAKASTQASYDIKNVQNKIVYSLNRQAIGIYRYRAAHSKCSLQPSDLEMEQEYRL
nr:hypothetical protein BgiMline_032274 [Biomphalaria glabrata]